MSGSYQQALDYLYSFVNFEHRHIDQYAAENISLERPRKLLERLGNPFQAYPTVHVAGTKGKGSVSAMCATAMCAAGLEVGLYTSPHLQDFRDRIRILRQDDGDGRIPPDRVVEMVEIIKPAIEDIPDVTWYEIVTAMAFVYFAREGVDIAVIEVGLGGRLDATNVITPLVSAITSLSLDHTYLLGDTLEEIAAEKGGIIKAGIPVVVSPQPAEALDCLREIAAGKRAPLILIDRDWRARSIRKKLTQKQIATTWRQHLVLEKVPDGSFVTPGTEFELALSGRHQQENALAVLAVLNLLARRYPTLNRESAAYGLAYVVWPGRMQILAHGPDRPTVLVDCAHNVDSAEKLAYTLQHDFDYHKLWLIIGTTADKDVAGILRTLLPVADFAMVTSSGHPRANTPAELERMTANIGFKSEAFVDVASAFSAVCERAAPGDLICVTGSIFLVGDLLNHWDSLQSHVTA